MIDASILVPLPVGVPLVMAALMAALNRVIPRRAADVLAILTTVGVGCICGALIAYSSIEPIVYWFGGWTPRAGVALGISFVATPMGSGLATLVCGLVTASFLFSWRYFDSVGTLYHVLMLAFLGAMCGFALTGDLFNLFVFFELMSAAAYALCGYKIEEAGPLQGALNFGIINTVGAFLVLSGIALLYGRTGALNMAQIGRALGGQVDGLIVTAFALIACGFLVKAAAVPFHFWLADAHAVAPTPVCVLFSGVMVELGVYAVGRVYWSVMDMPFASHRPALRGVLIGMGVLTAVVGAIMCFAQRHVKRLLAFSTVSHIGLLVVAVGLLKPLALSGAAIYTVGHGMVKGALFLCSGILLHRLGSVDEIELRGRGRRMPGTAVLFVIAGVGLAGIPPFATFSGEATIDEAAKSLGQSWVHWVFFFAGAVTAGAVLRVAGRVFGGMGRGVGHVPGAKYIEEARETAGPHRRVPPTMFLPAAALVVLAIIIPLLPDSRRGFELAGAEMADGAAFQARVLDGAKRLSVDIPHTQESLEPSIYRGIGASALALALAAIALLGEGFEARAAAGRLANFFMKPLRALHSGHIGDYVAFLTFGVAVFGGVLALLLRLL